MDRKISAMNKQSLLVPLVIGFSLLTFSDLYYILFIKIYFHLTVLLFLLDLLPCFLCLILIFFFFVHNLFMPSKVNTIKHFDFTFL